MELLEWEGLEEAVLRFMVQYCAAHACINRLNMMLDILYHNQPDRVVLEE